MREGINKILNSKSKTFLTFCFCFILGSVAASLFLLPRSVTWYLYYTSCFLGAAIIILWNKKLARFLLASFVFLILGITRFSLTLPDCNDEKFLCFFNGEKVEIVGRVADEPNIKIGSAEYIVTVEKMVLGSVEQNITGKVFVKGLPYPEYKYGDKLEVKCKIMSPGTLDTGTFRYDKYLAKFGVWSVCFDPKISPRSGEAGNILLRKIYSLKRILQEKIRLIWPEPSATLMGGILYGGKNGLPDDLAADFSSTGVSHIVAVSGYNITIIVVTVMGLFVALGMYRQHAYYLVLVLTFSFVVFSGLSASAVRAAIMGLMVLTARQVGRGSSTLNILIFTAAVIQAANPYLLVWDAGFQLSFLATIGLFYLSPHLKIFFEWLPEAISEVLSTTMSAIILTLPIMLYQFGSLSIIAPITNLLILWILPFIMLSGFVALVTSFISLAIGRLISIAAYAGLSYVIIVVQYFGSKSWSHTLIKIPLWLMIIFYLLIFAVIRYVSAGDRRHNQSHEKSKSI